MFDFIKPKVRVIGICIVVVLVVFGLVACSPKKSESGSTAFVVVNGNAVKGTLKVYDTAAEAQASGGKSIEGSEEDKLQQERIAGGAVSGGIKSKNLQPLKGITDYSQGDYNESYGIYGQPPAVNHNFGANCLTCHSIKGTPTQQVKVSVIQLPSGHASANLTNADCATCHKVK